MTSWQEDRESFAPEPGVHETAVIKEGARVHETAYVGPYCVIGSDAFVGERCLLHEFVSLTGDVRLGKDCVVHPFSRLGGAAIDYEHGDGSGGLEVGDRCVIYERVLLSLGTPKGDGATRIGDDCLLMFDVHVGHDARIGNNVTLGPSTLLAGHVWMGDGSRSSGRLSVLQNVRIGSYALLGVGSNVHGHVLPYMRAMGDPARLLDVNRVGLERAGYTRERLEAVYGGLEVLRRKAPGSWKGEAGALRDLGADAGLLADFVEGEAGGRGYARFMRGK